MMKTLDIEIACIDSSNWKLEYGTQSHNTALRINNAINSFAYMLSLNKAQSQKYINN